MVFILVDHASISWVLFCKVLKTLSVTLDINYLAHARDKGAIKYVFFVHLLAAFLKSFTLDFSTFLCVAKNL